MQFTLHALAVLLAADSGSPVLDAAWPELWRDLLIEGAGIFWIVAELAILFAVTVGCRVLRERPLPHRLALTRRERWIALGLLVFSIGLAACVYGRFLVWTPLPTALEAAGGLDRPEVSRAAYGALSDHIQTHVAIWCVFIAGWVALEIAIVAQGIRAFRALSNLTGTSTGGATRLAVAALVTGSIALFATDAGAQFSRAIEMALQSGYKGALDDADVGYRFVELYLRVAGAVWVVVEWIAAVYLVRGYFMLTKFVRERAHVA